MITLPVLDSTSPLPADSSGEVGMYDRYGRTIRYLRLSLTNACPMRCTYCRPDGALLAHKGDMMTAGEIAATVDHLVEEHGLRKVRLTGAEPTSRNDFVSIVRRLAGIDDLYELSMTTNALTLARHARTLADAGLSRVNISLDSLRRDRFRRITGIDGLHLVMAGIDAALDAELTPVKVNTVVVRGQNDDELVDLVRFAIDRQVEIRFIELMPMGPLASSWSDRYVPAAEMKDRLGELGLTWNAVPTGNDAARRYRATLPDGQQVNIGFITAMSCPFCDACDRIRIAADGSFYPCLMDRPAGSLLSALRPVIDFDELDYQIERGLLRKAAEHPATGTVTMTDIGG